MAPKRAGAVAAKSNRSGTHAHATYQDMIMDAILALKDRNGSGRPSLKKYVRSNNELGVISDKMFDALFNKALKSGVDKGIFQQPKGPSGGTKAAKKTAAPKAVVKPEVKKPVAVKEKVTPKETPVKEKAAPKEEVHKEKTVTKKAVPAKKAAKPVPAKKAAPIKKAAPKKAAVKTAPRAARKTPAKAEEKAAAPVLHKTKSGRVTKVNATPPQIKATPKKKAATPKPKSAKKDKAEASV